MALLFPVESGHVMMFARAVGDPNPVYYDGECAAAVELGHNIAPPTFVTSSFQFDPDALVRPKIGEPWLGSGREPSGTAGAGTGLHAEQEFEYHRHVRPGDVLTFVQREGTSWEREGRRGGTLRFHETIVEFFDEFGELVVKARSVVVHPSLPVGGE
jgi:acyl dehydratase